VELFIFKFKKYLKYRDSFDNIISFNQTIRFETCQPDFLSTSSFKLNYVGADPKWIVQFN
jgi:hypothetical protein